MIAFCEFECEDSARFPSRLHRIQSAANKYQRGSVGGATWRMDSATRIPVNDRYTK